MESDRIQQTDVSRMNSETDVEIQTELLWSPGVPGSASRLLRELPDDVVSSRRVPDDAVWSAGVVADVVWSDDILANLYHLQFTAICQNADRHQKKL